MDEIRERITAKSSRIKQYTNGKKQFEENSLFPTNRKMLFHFFTEGDGNSVPPNMEEATKFWSELWGVTIAYNDEATRTQDVEVDLQHVLQQPDIVITKKDFERQC